MRAHILIAIAACLVVGACKTIASNGVAEAPRTKSSISGADRGIAIQGYDAVAYWTEGTDVEGRPEVTLQWSGTTWRFASAAHRELFQQAPERYAPQYGGHCSLSVANGQTSRGAGDAWAIHEGKLYLNGSKEVRTRWRRNIAQNIHLADLNWPGLKRRLEAD